MPGAYVRLILEHGWQAAPLRKSSDLAQDAGLNGAIVYHPIEALDDEHLLVAKRTLRRCARCHGQAECSSDSGAEVLVLHAVGHVYATLQHAHWREDKVVGVGRGEPLPFQRKSAVFSCAPAIEMRNGASASIPRRGAAKIR